MTTATTTPRLSYTADGSTVAFTFNFEIADASSIAVYDGSTKKTLTTHYTVSFDSGTSGTGTVTFTSAPSASNTVTLVRDTNLARTTDFETSGAFLATTVNAELDRLSQAVIDATNKVETRSILLAEPSTETPTLTFGDASARANKNLGFDGSGDIALISDTNGTVTSVGISNTDSNLSISSSPVTTAGNIQVNLASTISANLNSGGISVSSNNITGLRSNENVAISANGSGRVTLGNWSATGSNCDDGGTFTTIDINGGNIDGVTIGANTSDTSTINSAIIGGANPKAGTFTTLTANTSAVLDGVTITDNTISTNASNANLEINANGSGTVNLENLKVGTSGATVTTILDEDAMGSDSATSLATQQSIRAYADTKAVLTGSTNNQITTVTGANAIQGESNLTFDGSTLGVTGNITATTNIENDAIRITDNTILGLRSNDNITITPAGTGSVAIAKAAITGGTISGLTSFANTGSSTLDGVTINDNTISSNASNADLEISANGSGKVSISGDRWPTSGAVGGYVLQTDANGTLSWVQNTGGVSLSGATNNAMVTITGAGALTQETNLTFDGTTLSLTGVADLEGVRIKDNTISTNASNSNLEISANSSGVIKLNDNTDITGDLSVSGAITGTLATGNQNVTGTLAVTGQLDVDGVRIKDNEISGTRSNENLKITTSGNGEMILSAGTGRIQFGGINFENNQILASRSNDDLVLGTGGVGKIVFDADCRFEAGSEFNVVPTAQVTCVPGGGNSLAVGSHSGQTGAQTIYGSGGDYHMRIAESSDFFNFTTQEDPTGQLTIQHASGGGAWTIRPTNASIDESGASNPPANQSLSLDGFGTGRLMLGITASDLTSVGSNAVGATMSYEDLTTSGGTRQYALNRIAQFKAVANTDSNNTNDRFRIQDTVQFDLNGSTYSQTSNELGPQIQHLVEIKNTGSSTSDGLGAANGQTAGIFFPGSGGAGSTITLTNAYNIRAFSLLEPASGETVNVTNNYDFYSSGPTFSGAGTEAVTNHYGLFVSNNQNATNKYGVYVEGDSYINQLGGITLQNGDITAGAIKIEDHTIKTTRSNDSLKFQASGTGQIEFSPNGAEVDDVFSDNARYDFGANRIFSEQNADAANLFSGSADRRYANGDFVSVSLSSSSSNSQARWRSGSFSLIDMKGFDLDASAAYFKGIVTRYVESTAKNSSTSSASTLNNVAGVYSSINTSGTDNGAGLTIDSAYGFVSDIFLGEGTSETVALTDAYHYAVKGSGGGGAVTDEYGYYVDGLSGTNNYAFWDESNSLSKFGAVILQNQSGDPSGVTDSAHIYAKDDSGSSEVHVRDEAGNVTKISPHNDAGEWEFYSRNTKTGKTVRINMERMIRRLEDITGETFIEAE